MKPTHFTNNEGDTWLEWPDLGILPQQLLVHAIKFDTGEIWDTQNGWTNPIRDFGTCQEHGCNERLIRQDDYIGCPVHNFSKETSESHYALGCSLQEAIDIITGERQKQYGNPEDSFELIAEYWHYYLSSIGGRHLTPLDVSHLMMLFKLARCSGQQSKRDNYIDIQGYAAIAADRLI